MLQNEKGASAIEFALILPLFLILVFGLIEFSVIMYDKAVVTNASREGARFGVLYNTDINFGAAINPDAAIRAQVNSFLSENLVLINLGGTSLLPLPDENIDISPDDDSPDNDSLPVRTRSNPVTVSVTYPYDFLLLPNFLPGLPKTLNLNGTTTMRLE